MRGDTTGGREGEGKRGEPRGEECDLAKKPPRPSPAVVTCLGPSFCSPMDKPVVLLSGFVSPAPAPACLPAALAVCRFFSAFSRFPFVSFFPASNMALRQPRCAVTLGRFRHIDVHPLVVIGIIDHYSRRTVSNVPVVVGALLGHLQADRVEVTDVVPLHLSSPSDAANPKTLKILENFERINPREQVVGWYSTCGELSHQAVGEFHRLLGRKFADSIHILVDLPSRNATTGAFSVPDGGAELALVDLKAYISTVAKIGDIEVGLRFDRVSIEYKCSIPEVLTGEFLQKARPFGAQGQLDEEAFRRTLGSGASLPSEQSDIQNGIKQVLSLLQQALDAVRRNIAKREGDRDSVLARQLARALSSVPVSTNMAPSISAVLGGASKSPAAPAASAAAPSSPSYFDQLFTQMVLDLMLVMYLGESTRTEVALSEKILAAMFERLESGEGIGYPSSRRGGSHSYSAVDNRDD